MELIMIISLIAGILFGSFIGLATADFCGPIGAAFFAGLGWVIIYGIIFLIGHCLNLI